MSTKPGPEVTFEQIVGEALTLAGGGRAILLQIAHPAIGRGVVEHSDFALRTLDRFHATMSFVYAAAFGTPDEYAEIRRRVGRAHAHVRASAEGTKPAYSAFDPQLQLWVAATLHQTMMHLHTSVFGPLSATETERVYQRMRGRDRYLQLPQEAWPATTTAFDAYWEESVSTLRVTEDARRVAAQLLDPPGIPGWLRLALPDARLLTAGLLPPSVRDQFGMPWDDRRGRRFDRRMRLLRTVYPRVPVRLRHSPRDAYLRRLRESMSARDDCARPGDAPEADDRTAPGR